MKLPTQFIYYKARYVYLFDVRLMRQVISNLIVNILKYSPSANLVWLELVQERQAVIMTAKDKGLGIPVDDLKHLFEPFHRVPNMSALSSTGLGLSIAKQAVELHQGTIIPTSELDVATVFIATLPKSAQKDNLYD